MRRIQSCLRRIGLVSALVVITGCTYQVALQRLTPPERTEFRVYNKVMTSAQARTYLTKATAAERTAYLEQSGLAQRFQALEPQDREAVLAGSPRQGMRANALRFLWGDPYYDEGYVGHYEHWFYLGPTYALAEYGNQYGDAGTMVEVQLVDGRVEWWLEFVPTDLEDGAETSRP